MAASCLQQERKGQDRRVRAPLMQLFTVTQTRYAPDAHAHHGKATGRVCSAAGPSGQRFLRNGQADRLLIRIAYNRIASPGAQQSVTCSGCGLMGMPCIVCNQATAVHVHSHSCLPRARKTPLSGGRGPDSRLGLHRMAEGWAQGNLRESCSNQARLEGQLGGKQE